MVRPTMDEVCATRPEVYSSPCAAAIAQHPAPVFQLTPDIAHAGFMLDGYAGCPVTLLLFRSTRRFGAYPLKEPSHAPGLHRLMHRKAAPSQIIHQPIHRNTSEPWSNLQKEKRGLSLCSIMDMNFCVDSPGNFSRSYTANAFREGSR
jgi:hypothetical protein